MCPAKTVLHACRSGEYEETFTARDRNARGAGRLMLVKGTTMREEEDPMLFWSLPEIYARACLELWLQAVEPSPVKVSRVERHALR